MKVIFLDVDGVLNNQVPSPSGYFTIDPDKRDRLNWLTDETKAVIVMSSAWRYLVHGGSMSKQGLQYLLYTHGIKGTLLDITRRDTVINDGSGREISLPAERGKQIQDWLDDNPRVDRYVVIDNMDLGISMFNHPFVQTQTSKGLTYETMKRAEFYLNKGYTHDANKVRALVMRVRNARQHSETL